MSSAPDLTSRILRNQRLVLAGGIALLVTMCWWFLLAGAGMPSDMGMRPPMVAVVAMWWVMMTAMMMPSAAPAVLLYARVRLTRSSDRAIVGSWVFLAGYLALWLLFSLLAAIAQQALLDSSMALQSEAAKSGVLIAAGAYQLSPLKAACLGECRSPVQFISRHWRAGWTGALRLGFLHGAYCIGCCWALMAVLFVGGIMNLLWVVALAVIVTAEKIVPLGEWVARLSGAGLIAWGAVSVLYTNGGGH